MNEHGESEEAGGGSVSERDSGGRAERASARLYAGAVAIEAGVLIVLWLLGRYFRG